MKDKLNEYKDILEEHERDTELLKHLYENGYLDLDGNPIERNQ